MGRILPVYLLPQSSPSKIFWRPITTYQQVSLKRRSPITGGSSRFVHSDSHESSTDALPTPTAIQKPPSSSEAIPLDAPLSCLPFTTLLRSYLVTRISSTPSLLGPSLAVLSFLGHAKSPLFNPDRNPILRFILKKTFYAQFCAGETPKEVQQTITGLKKMGYSGVILGYAKEVVMQEDEATALCQDEQASAKTEEIDAWEKGTLDTIALSARGEFAALKFSGAGQQALKSLQCDQSPQPELEAAIVRICEAAKERSVRLLFDAEQQAIQKGIDSWTVEFMRRYNKGGRAIVYGTYQAYLKATPEVLASHLNRAKEDGFTLGVKLVRGAYLGSDPRDRIWETKKQTDDAYNSIAESLMRRKYLGILKQPLGGEGRFPEIDLVLAGHNSESVSKARFVRDEQASRGEDRIDMVYGQLMGMADNISCALVQAAKMAKANSEKNVMDMPKTFKYLVWGSVGECTLYLLRRAQENRDAVTRTEEGRKALGWELKRRLSLSAFR
ncbi:MAG: hypothetical protein Q9227_000065 [Pyrenula ochraceoflavens]